MAFVDPVSLSRDGVLLEPLSQGHVQGLEEAAADGELWLNRVTSVPGPGEVGAYVDTALAERESGERCAFAVLEERTGRVLGTTGFHEIAPEVRRVEIGYTWYAASVQRSHVNTTCKLLLLTHAFDVLGCRVVGWRTDNFNVASQRAIERLGAHRDGVIRGNKMRRDGTIRDTVLYSVTAGEWPEISAHLEGLLASRGRVESPAARGRRAVS